MNTGAILGYRIDGEDAISFVDEGWNRFANANDGAEFEAQQVLGHSLWDYITDELTRDLYRRLVARVREGKTARFSLRCDSPACRRLLEMRMSAGPERGVEFETRTLSEEARAAVPLLARETKRTSGLLMACAWCNRIDAGSGVYVEVEDAMARLGLFERERMPQVTHGICPACLESMMNTLDSM